MQGGFPGMMMPGMQPGAPGAAPAAPAAETPAKPKQTHPKVQRFQKLLTQIEGQGRKAREATISDAARAAVGAVKQALDFVSLIEEFPQAGVSVHLLDEIWKGAKKAFGPSGGPWASQLDQDFLPPLCSKALDEDADARETVSSWVKAGWFPGQKVALQAALDVERAQPPPRAR